MVLVAWPLTVSKLFGMIAFWRPVYHGARGEGVCEEGTLEGSELKRGG